MNIPGTSTWNYCHFLKTEPEATQLDVNPFGFDFAIRIVARRHNFNPECGLETIFESYLSNSINYIKKNYFEQFL